MYSCTKTFFSIVLYLIYLISKEKAMCIFWRKKHIQTFTDLKYYFKFKMSPQVKYFFVEGKM